MKRMKRLRKIFVYLLVLLIAVSSIPMTSFAEEEIEQASAVTMKMRKTEGTVKAADKNGKAVSVFKNMRLYDGYKVETLKNGYAWIDLDSSKLIKLDAYSRTAVQKSGKELDIILEKGKLFFNVAEPLADDETLSIRTSTTAVGIRGTCGWIEVVNKNETKISILEGTVQAAVINPVTGEVKVESVSGGETVTCVAYDTSDQGGKFDILRSRFSEKDVPGFVIVDTVNDKSLVEKIFENSQTGVDLRSFTPTEAKKRLYTEQRVANNEPLVNNSGDDSDSSGTPAPSASSASSAPETPTTPVMPGTPTTPEAPTAPDTPTTPESPALSGVAYEFDGSTKTLTIYGSGKMQDYFYESQAPWYGYSPNIKTVIIEDGVTSIGDRAFSGCSSLESVTIPSSVTSIGSWAFHDTSLTSVTIPSSVTSITEGAFDGCSSLVAINVDSGNAAYCSVDGILFTKDKDMLIAYPARKTDVSYAIPSSVTSIGWKAFVGCSNLESVTIPDGVTSIAEGMFYGCSSLASVTITEGVTDIGWDAFYGCSSLTSVTIPESVTSIAGSAFALCSSLTSVTIPEGVTYIALWTFYGCSSLESVTIPEGVTSIAGNAFELCSSLTSVTIPEGVEEIYDRVFYGCSSLTSVTIPSSVTRISWNAFENCNSSLAITYSGTKADFNAAFGDDIDLGIIKDKVTCSDGRLDSPATSSLEAGEGIAALSEEEGAEIIESPAEPTAATTDTLTPPTPGTEEPTVATPTSPTTVTAEPSPTEETSADTPTPPTTAAEETSADTPTPPTTATEETIADTTTPPTTATEETSTDTATSPTTATEETSTDTTTPPEEALVTEEPTPTDEAIE